MLCCYVQPLRSLHCRWIWRSPSFFQALQISILALRLYISRRSSLNSRCVGTTLGFCSRSSSCLCPRLASSTKWCSFTKTFGRDNRWTQLILLLVNSQSVALSNIRRLSSFHSTSPSVSMEKSSFFYTGIGLIKFPLPDVSPHNFEPTWLRHSPSSHQLPWFARIIILGYRHE